MARRVREDGSVYYDNDERFRKYEDLYLETGDIKYLWVVYPEIVHAIKSCMVKALKGKMIPFFNEKAENAALYFIDLRKRKPKRTKRLMGYASFLAMRALHQRWNNENWEEFPLIENEDWIEDTEEASIDDN